MSVVTRILTGLSEHEWKEAWAKVEPKYLLDHWGVTLKMPEAGETMKGWRP